MEPHAPYLIPDCRRPGQAMAPVPLKLPTEAAAQLQAAADRLATSRTALCRSLVLVGLERLGKGGVVYAAQAQAVPLPVVLN
jgi:hypothetical protein